MASITTPAAQTLVSSTADLSAYPAWSAATAYTTGQRVHVPGTNWATDYEAIGPSTNKPPASYSALWMEVGASNRYRMFDATVSTRTEGLESVSVTVSVAQRCSRLGLISMRNARAVAVSMRVDGAEVWSTSAVLMRGRISNSWSDFLFGERDYAETLFVDIPRAYLAFQLVVTVTGDTGATVGIGHLSIGYTYNIGPTAYPLELEYEDFSRIETDEFGDTTLVPRGNLRRVELEVPASGPQIDRVARLLDQLVATPAMYDLNEDGTDFEILRLFGVHTGLRTRWDGYNNYWFLFSLRALR